MYSMRLFAELLDKFDTERARRPAYEYVVEIKTIARDVIALVEIDFVSQILAEEGNVRVPVVQV